MEERETEIRDFPKDWSEWNIREKIGEGSCGNVYRAENKSGHVSAVKVMNVPADSFEVQALTRLEGCPYIVELEDYRIQEADGGQWKVFLRMECLKSLTELLHEKPLTQEESLRMMIDLCRGLEKCEQERIIHRDIKPENILITVEGRAKLGDFGIAAGPLETDGGHRIQGTFTYMAPEIFHGQKYDRTADIYSLGMVFYRIMNGGREPFVSREKQIISYKDSETALKKRMEGVPFPAPADASAEFARILQKACAFRSEKRYQKAAALRKDLEKCLRKEKSKLGRMLGRWSRWKKAAAAAVLLAAVCGTGVWVWWRTPVLQQHREDGFTWSLGRDGTLTFRGDGVLTSYLELQDWQKKSGEIKKLVICGNVTALDQQFGNCQSLRRVELPEGLETIGNYVFQNCQNLKEISFPSTLKEIGEMAFTNCLALEAVTLPEGLETISGMAFGICANLAEVEIPSSVKEIGSDAFRSTAWLEERQKEGGFLIVNDILLAYFGDEENVVISEDMGIRKIGGRAFVENQKLRSVTLTDAVEEVGEEAFSGCSTLASVTLSPKLREISASMFRNCPALEKIMIPAGVERIGTTAFLGCQNLKEILLPETVSAIEERAFEGTALYEEQEKKSEYMVLGDFLIAWQGDETELVIPENLGIRHIADNAFAQNENLKKVVIPEGVVSLGETCFFGCVNLEQIEFPQSLREIGRGAMATTKWWEERQQEGGPFEVNGIDITY